MEKNNLCIGGTYKFISSDSVVEVVETRMDTIYFVFVGGPYKDQRGQLPAGAFAENVVEYSPDLRTKNVGPMTAAERQEIRELLFDNLMDSMFGDSQVAGYVRDGFPEFKGVNNMTDELRLAAWREEQED